nr:hypothetical protein [uncultured Butyrivibrio sp.]
MDKLEFLNILINKGFDAALFNGGIPTAFIGNASDISAVSKNIKKIAKDEAYTQSFGVALLSRKSA